ncbi:MULTISPECIES: beta-galactosidase [unclassified Cryobacterium]|uniref:beta-galactosidase n=1 Tax=unclassified Cryobacterium TaxID=2649013 RepID=UPI00106CE397|nr:MULTISPECIES: beta-galactosidase [unclassified Cryobacterium]TFC08247.1 beta-galactosidase [Cryobacterium sp. MDB2-33-2]TFC21915.1 beta-galactosidase [Cryobacterium sp. MDB2-10]
MSTVSATTAATSTATRWVRWPDAHTLADGTESLASGTARIAYGADYNPEQWPEAVWADDMRLMREAGVNIVSVGIFSWALLQPTIDSWDFGWLDRALDLLHSNGIAVDLATATASPPPWLTEAHPEVLPVNRLGETIWPGGRQQWRPTSPVFRRYALALVEKMAMRYADHPALAMWHISNELGCHNVYDYSDDAAAAFRGWLAGRYGSLVELNRAWGTAFWSQNYSSWSQILPPRLAATHPNPTQQLDFARFSSDALKDYLVAEREILRQATPEVPITTNFMVMGETRGMDYADWADEVDIVSNDHYLLVADPEAFEELSFSANLTGQIAHRAPWFLMEHSTSAVNWQPVNQAKSPGQLRRDSLTHVAHGADAVCFFQWRQSLAGAEKFHSAMLPHAGEDSTVFRRVARFGGDLAGLAEVAGSRTRQARIGILFDWDSWWASELDSHPTELLRYKAEAMTWYTAALANGLQADIIPARSVLHGPGLDGYDLVIAPMLYVVTADLAEALTGYVTGGGHLTVGVFSGIADADDHIHPGGYPGAFRELLGVRAEEFGGLLAGQAVGLSGDLPAGSTGTLLTHDVTVRNDVDVLARFDDGPFPGVPAITGRAVGAGRASFVGTVLDREALVALVGRFAADVGIASPLPSDVRGTVQLAVRETDTFEYLFYINHSAHAVTVALTPFDGCLTAVDLGGSTLAAGSLTLPATGVAVLSRPRAGE